MGKIKKLHQGALVGEGSSEEVYPVTAAQAVYHSNGSDLETLIDMRDPVSVSQDAGTGKTTITVGSDSYDVATQPVSVSQNTLTIGGVAQGELAGQLIDNPEWVKVVTDSNDKVLYGVKADGKFYFGDGCPPQIQKYVLEHKQEILELLNSKVDKESGKSLIQTEVAEGLKYITNPEWINVEVDSNGKILSGRGKDGIKKELAGLETPTILIEKSLELSPAAKKGLQETLPDTIEIAGGNKEEPSIENSEYFVKTDYIKDNNSFEKKYNRNIVAINHDDFRLADIVGTRRIYNKYGFSANFNFMLHGFSTIDEKNQIVDATKKLLREGHKIGLHNYFDSSFWYMNKLFDIRPDGTATYAPTLSELQGSEPDHTGVNTFGTTITSETKFRDCNFKNLPNELNTNVINATAEHWRAVIGFYCTLFNDTAFTILDLNDELQTKTTLEWAEYWYNELIDSTLGYSTSGGYAEKFANDYAVPSGASASSYYPDAEHLENGKIVFFDDTNNPNYSDASYQKVGYFTKGLFKGCASTRNCEVFGRIIDIATAFCRHYFGMTYFDNFGRHGERFCYNLWIDEDGFNYDNRDKTILTYDTQKIFISLTGKFTSLFDIMKSRNIKMTNYGTTGEGITVSVIGQQKLFIGQSDVVGNFDNIADYIQYFDFFGNANSMITVMDYATFSSFAEPHKDNWLKWAYEKAGQTITNVNGDTMKMYTYIRTAINWIKECLGTGKIPVFSFDTVYKSPNIMAAVEILSQFCWANDISIVPMEVARKRANENRVLLSNLFPNPGFNQILLPMFGGSSTEVDAYLPDGWSKRVNDSNYDFVVEYNQENARREFTVNRTTSGSMGSIVTKIYGLGEGKYKFSCYYKTTNTSASSFSLFKRFANEKPSDSPSHVIVNGGTNSEWTLVEQEFTIEPPYRVLSDNSPVNRLCNGYSNNVVHLELRLYVQANKTTSIALPSISKI